MVYTERTDKCISQKETSTTSGKQQQRAHQQHTQQQQQQSSKLNGSSGSSTAWSKHAASDDKWKYNQMVRDDRRQFNGMHFS